MSRLLLPLEHPKPSTGHAAEDALLHGLKRLPRRVSKYSCSTASTNWTSPLLPAASTCRY